MMRPREKFVSEICECCGMDKEYRSGLNKGLVHVLIQIAKAIKAKGINCIHLDKEALAQGYLTSNQKGNASHLRIHGLLAEVQDEPGNWCLTTKGINFLQGALIPRYAVRSKTEHRTIGYWYADKYRCSIKDFEKESEWYAFEDFFVQAGRVVTDPEEIGKAKQFI